MFGCGCPIYARLEIRDPVTKDVLFQHNGSLKGITAKEAAEELVNTWFVKYLSGETPAAHTQEAAVTIEEAIKRFLAEKANTLPPPKPVVLSDAVISFRKTKKVGAEEPISDSVQEPHGDCKAHKDCFCPLRSSRRPRSTVKALRLR